MMKLRLVLDEQTSEALMRSALRELRPTPLQAEVLLRRALGLPVPKESPEEAPETEQAGPVPAGAGHV